MNTDEIDNTLRPLFHELRSRDGQVAPPFEALVARPQPLAARSAADVPRGTGSLPVPSRTAAATSRAGWPWLRFAAAAVVLIAVSLSFVVIRGRLHHRESNLAQWAALSAWRASTDTLLVAANTPWGTNTVIFSDSWIGGSAAMPETTQTNRKENR